MTKPGLDSANIAMMETRRTPVHSLRRMGASSSNRGFREGFGTATNGKELVTKKTGAQA
jgi:hypothetical protein